MDFQISRFSRSLFLFGVFFAVSQIAEAKVAEPTVTRECHSTYWQTLERKHTYCVEKVLPAGYVPSAENPIHTLFYMHGIFGDHNAWYFGWSQDFEKFAREDGRAWAAVYFDTAPVSFFSDFRGQTHGHSAYETWFIHELLPTVTHQYGLCPKRACRGLVAESMGGFGVLKTSLRYPELFAAVAASAPALPAFDPYGNVEVWAKYFAAHPVGRTAGTALVLWAREYFKDRANFAKLNPIRLVERFDERAHPFPKMYIQCGGRDFYGFEDGFALLRAALERRGLPYTWRFYPKAGHDVPGTTSTLLGFLFQSI